MPFVRITASGAALASEQVSLLCSEMTELMACVLGKRPDLTSVLVGQVAAAGWAIGGSPVKAAVHVEATSTARTNSPEHNGHFTEMTVHLLKCDVRSDLHAA